jgi:hypothetical protein
MSQHRGVLSSPSSPQSLQSSKKRYVFLQRSKSRIRCSPSLTSSFLHTSSPVCHYHHIPIQPIYLGPHTCISLFDCMARLIPLNPWFDYAINVCKYVLAVSPPMSFT